MFKIKFSAIPAVSLIMSVGISVEFVAHFVLAFLMEGIATNSTRNDRVRMTFIRMLPPILQGGISTFFSIILLGFSKFAFVRRYFFLPFLCVCVIGLLNGLILLPTVLSLIGPTAVECCPERVCGQNETKQQELVVKATPSGIELCAGKNKRSEEEEEMYVVEEICI